MIDNTKAKPNTTEAKVVSWSTGEGVEQVVADDMLVHVINDRVYLSFGAIQVPVSPTITSIEVKTVARLVMTPAELRKIASAFNEIVAQLDARAGEE